MAKCIVIVESPTKVKTINKMLGRKFKVVSSMGHLIDLPKSTLGVDLENDFEPKLIVVRSKQKILTQLKKSTKDATEIYVATDPDREGEAIGWNLVKHIGEGKKIYRVFFQEITKDAVLKAFQNPREFDQKKIEAQLTRRVLDRIVGYKISPILWKKVGSRLSAGRVQSVALRLIVDREQQINDFKPQEYWSVTGLFQKEGMAEPFEAALEKIAGKKFKITNEAESADTVAKIRKESYVVTNSSKRLVRRNANPPFITSTLQQEAFNKLGMNANKTMMIAQQLYEGVDMGNGETFGLITYMRTDSVNLSVEAVGKAREYIEQRFGPDYVPAVPNKYKSKKSAQEAHEAIRPTDVVLAPYDVRAHLDGDQSKLYTLIWNRYVSCQMTPAVYEYKKLEITGGDYQFGASGSTLQFDGHLVVDREAKKEEEEKIDFSQFSEKDQLLLKDIKPDQHFTKPPPRFSDASLVKALEEDGIGRPSTYASIVQTLVFRNYVIRDRGYFAPTELGTLICGLLVEHFPKVMNVGFTASMEEKLDEVEEGTLAYSTLLQEFYIPFKEHLDEAEQNIEKTQNYIDQKCPECDRRMVIKWGRRGKFLSCSGFPECKHSAPFTTGVACPDCREGELVLRRSNRGARFYGCTRYPDCTYVSRKLPSEETEPTAKTSEPQEDLRP